MHNTIFADALSCVQFLSRLPTPKNDGEESEPDFRKSSYAFPLAGIIIALPGAITLWCALIIGLTPAISAILAVCVVAITTGALHEDGLADVADGFFGGHSKVRKLEIMRDSHIGTYGTLALIFSIGLKTALLAALATTYDVWETVVTFIAVASLSRAAILYPWSTLPAAREETGDNADKAGKEISGLSARFGSPDKSIYLKGALFSLIPIGLLLLAAGFWGTLAAIVSIKLFVLGVTALSKQQIGGHTGDTLGATQQISELGLLLGLAMLM